MSDANIGGIFFLGLVAAAAMMKRNCSNRSSSQFSPDRTHPDDPRRGPQSKPATRTDELRCGLEQGSDAGTKDSGFAGYRDRHEWHEATFGDVRNTRDPGREGGFAGYASKADWQRATFEERAPRPGTGGRRNARFDKRPGR